ncbi:MAG: hypothetical protein KDK41_12210 [Leptospiraceae bacterium]|nr:hypothetical protein [Leptospiraceae bacterium]MCB1201401.1 hypothetical protein [Leptospiraceae bacterium]
MSVELVGFGLDNKKLIKKFVKFSWKHYSKEEKYIPQLNGELLGNKLLGMKGLLTPEHPYHKNAEVYHWLAYREKKIVGRISASINKTYNQHHSTNIGNFGFFESIKDDEVGHALFNAAAGWLKERGIDTMRGPGNYGNATHEVQSWAMNSFQDPPTIELTMSKWWYPKMAERFGMVKAKDYYAYLNPVQSIDWDRDNKLLDRMLKRSSLSIRKMDMKNIKSEVDIILHIYNQAWKDNWGFLPLTSDEGQVMAETLKLVADPNLMLFVMDGDREVAVIGTLLDLNEKFLRRKSIFGNSDIVRLLRFFIEKKSITRSRIMFFGILPEYRKTGIDAMVLFKTRNYLYESTKVRAVDASLVLEENMVLRNLFGHFGGIEYKKFRIYDYALK